MSKKETETISEEPETTEQKATVQDTSQPHEAPADESALTDETETDSDEETAKEDEIPELTELEKVQAQFNEVNDKYLRLYSEFDNFRRRTAKERVELMSHAGEEMIMAMLPMLDDFERAIESNKKLEDVKVIKEGFELLYSKLKGSLTQKGLKNMDSMETEFDTDLHEAITKIPAPKKKLKGKVVDVIEKGYYLNDKVIRYAKVVVGE